MLSLLVGIACQTKQSSKVRSAPNNPVDVKAKQEAETSEINNPPTLKPGPWELKRVSKDVISSERKQGQKD